MNQHAGSVNSPRRADIIAQLRLRGVRVLNERVFGADREKQLLRAKVLLNIHYHSSSLFETVRMQLVLSLRRFVISESTPDLAAMRDFGGAVVFAPYRGLVDTVISWLAKTPAQRHAVADRGYDYVTSRTMPSVLRPLLEEAVFKYSGQPCTYR